MAMTGNTANPPRNTGPRGRWDLWLLGIGVVVLLVIWIVDPFFARPTPMRGPSTGPLSPVAWSNPPDDWFKGKRGNLFQERVVATPQYDKDGVTFDLAKEKTRLEAWLRKNDHRDTLRRDPRMISAYHALDEDKGGRLSKHLQWFPHKVEAHPLDNTRYQTPYSESAGLRFEKSHLDEHVVPLFTSAELAKGPKVMKRWLVEYVPVNMHERGFTLADLDLTGCWTGVDHDGQPVFYYQIKPTAREAYGRFSAEYIGFESALIVEGYVVAVPYFMTRISERGQVSMRTKADTEALVEAIRSRLPGR